MAVYIVGDIHGHREPLQLLLHNAGLIDDRLRWSGGESSLWFMVDFFDRGPDGLGIVDLVMELQGQAADAGGEVRALLGNHEVLFMGAHRFRTNKRYTLNWKRNGGQDADMEMVTSRHMAWLRNLPAMALVADRLLTHADAMFYREYGYTVDEVNETFRAILHSDDTNDWSDLLEDFSERFAYIDRRGQGVANAVEMLYTYGGKQIIHGHTPLQYISDLLPVNRPYIYANQRCVNVDGGIYMGGSGFVYKLPDFPPKHSSA